MKTIVKFWPLALLALSACYKSQPRVMTAPEVISTVSEESEVTILKNSNEVDILFVIDNSESMRIHQENLAHNIKNFVAAFDDNENLDYHIGITSIFDSRRYNGTIVKSFNPNGALLPLKGEVGSHPRYYYTRDHDNPQILTDSIYIGVLPRQDLTTKEDLGPEFEEILSPIYAALTEPMISSETNKGFFRPQARLAIIMITDADDETPGLSVNRLDQHLRNIKKDALGDKISTFGVLAKRGECEKVDPGLTEGSAKRLESFLEITHGSELSLCKSNFGEMLTTIGKQIQHKAQKQIYRLKGVPEAGSIKVMIGDKEVAPGPQTWGYDPTQKAIIITAMPKKNQTTNQELPVAIRYTKVNMQNILNGRARSIGLPTQFPMTQAK